MTSLEESRQRVPEVRATPPPAGNGHPRRRWPWIVGVLMLLVGSGVLVIWLTTNRARPVTMWQAESRLGSSGRVASGSPRPLPGVYRYTGSGTEQLSVPPLSQSEGPTMPGTVTLQGSNCWTFRIDYSTHHWQTWHYCLHDGDLWEAGGQSWQLWSIGPLQATNLSTFSCKARTMSLPRTAVPGQLWEGRCTGTNTSVKGRTLSAGPYKFIGQTTISVAGSDVRAAHFLRLRTDSGAQHGTERSEVWLDEQNGLPLRLEQDIEVTSPTPFGTSTYTQVGVFAVTSLVAHR
jgi:hypothetical protein